MRSTVIIGAGHNALVAAFYLARAGRKPLVLERRSVVGGCAVTEEFAPGYRSSTLAHASGPIRPDIVRDMQLDRRVRFVAPDPHLVALNPNGAPLALSADVRRSVAEIKQHSARDAERYPLVVQTLERLGGFLSGIMDAPPLPIDRVSAGNAWELLQTARRFRALGKRESYSLLRWAPMAVADVVNEWFETDLLQAAACARGIFGTAMGPWSAGTGAVLLINSANAPILGGSSVTAIGGTGAITAAMADAAREAGAEILTDAPVRKILTKEDAIRAVVLEDGRELEAETIVSGVDPRRTFLQLVDRADLQPEFVSRMRNYRCPGTVAKLNVALRALPAFRGVTPGQMRGRLHIGADVDYLERAFDASKYGQISEAPYLDITFPSVVDPSLAPAERHVMSVHMQYAPFALRNGAVWKERRGALTSIVLRTLDEYAPGTSGLVEHAHVLTPDDLESEYGLTGGHIFHGEPALDQLLFVRPTLGYARYRTPIRGLFLCGAGTHPGIGLTGASGRNAAREILRM